MTFFFFFKNIYFFFQIDECMMPLFDTSAKTLSDFLNWLASGNATVRMAGALSIGNLARRGIYILQVYIFI